MPKQVLLCFFIWLSPRLYMIERHMEPPAVRLICKQVTDPNNRSFYLAVIKKGLILYGDHTANIHVTKSGLPTQPSFQLNNRLMTLCTERTHFHSIHMLAQINGAVSSSSKSVKTEYYTFQKSMKD